MHCIRIGVGKGEVFGRRIASPTLFFIPFKGKYGSTSMDKKQPKMCICIKDSQFKTAQQEG